MDEVAQVLAMPRIELLVAVPLVEAGAVRLPMRLLKTLCVRLPPVIRMPSTKAEVVLLATEMPQIRFFDIVVVVPLVTTIPAANDAAVVLVFAKLVMLFCEIV